MEANTSGSAPGAAPDLKALKKEYDLLLKKQIDTTKTITFVSFARVYSFGSKEVWRDIRVCGVLSVSMDRTRKAPIIQMFNPDRRVKPLELILELEVYINFSKSICRLSNKEGNVVSFIYHKRHLAFEFPDDKQAKYFIGAIQSLEETSKNEKDLKEKLKQQTKNIEKPNKKGFFRGIKKFFKGKEKVSDNKVKGFKKEQGISVNQFLIESTNVPDDIKDEVMKTVKGKMKNVGIKSKYLKDDNFRKEVEELIATHGEEAYYSSLASESTAADYEEEEKKRNNTVRQTHKTIDPIPEAPELPEELKESGKAGEVKPVEEAKVVKEEGGAPPPPPPPPAPPSMGGGPGGLPPPPPPKVELKKVEKKQINTGPSKAHEKRNSVQPMTLLEELQTHKLKGMTKRKEKPAPKQDNLENKLQELLDARREALNKNCGSSESDDESDDDSDEFD